MRALRFGIVAVITLMVLVALLPLVILLDLAGGGTGMGLCEGGLASCRTSYFDAPELLGILVLVLLLLGAVLRTLLKVRELAEGAVEQDSGRRTTGPEDSALGR
ncbi:MAG TPA: hypothetical protein VMM81_06865 [Acidimicrobiia bacterium]|nr:hypothetical protein [Acidimicrobiia bacterium]